MSPWIIEALGFAAACLTTIAFLPQALRAIRTRDTRALSLGMYVVFSVGVALWLAYGALIGSTPMILANGATLALALVILALKLKHG